MVDVSSRSQSPSPTTSAVVVETQPEFFSLAGGRKRLRTPGAASAERGQGPQLLLRGSSLPGGAVHLPENRRPVSQIPPRTLRRQCRPQLYPVRPMPTERRGQFLIPSRVLQPEPPPDYRLRQHPSEQLDLHSLHCSSLSQAHSLTTSTATVIVTAERSSIHSGKTWSEDAASTRGPRAWRNLAGAAAERKRLARPPHSTRVSLSSC